MNSAVQNLLLSAYRAARASGLLSTGPGRAVFEASYLFYKDYFEARHARHLRSLVRPGSWVIDVGANIGVFTRRFAEWIESPGRVLAIEPEAENFAALRRHMRRAGLEDRTELLQAAVAASSEMRHLAVNLDHPGDHRLAATGIPVASRTLDDLLAERHLPDVSLIKIDVQGAEGEVVSGAAQTLGRCRPALFIEVHDAGLQQFGSSAAALIQSLTARGYGIHLLGSTGITVATSIAEALRTVGTGEAYTDLLFIDGR